MGPDPAVEGVDPALQAVGRAAAQIGARAWAVGGYVRDRLLHRDHPDLDIVVEDGRGQDLAEAYAELVGARHPAVFPRFGTAQVNVGGRLVEFASARAESYARDSRKPDVRPATLDEDLRRRDFTVNTLLMDFHGNVVDRLGSGLPDLEARVLRTPRDPRQTFDDDPLRMLRAIRFAAQLGFELAPGLLPAMRELRDRARPPVLSPERVAEELRKMILSERPGLALDLMQRAGLLEVLLPEIEATRGVKQGGWHTHDVYGHTLQVVERTPPSLTERLSALFHDAGKPSTAAPDGSFVGHDAVGAEIAEEALRRLRFPHAEAGRVARVVRLHMRPVYYDSNWTESAVRRLARDAGDLLWPLVEVARADVAASAYPHPEKIDELAGRLRRALSEEPLRIRPQVSGEDIMRVLGIPAGPRVGEIKAVLEELVLDGRLAPDRESILGWLAARRGDDQPSDRSS